MAKRWIQKAAKKMEEKGTIGSFRKEMGAKKGKPIPLAKEQKAAKSGDPATRKKAQFALNVRK